MKKDLNFENDLALDLDDLHEEWRSHAQIRYKYASEVAWLEKEKQKAHEKVKVVRSQLIKEAKEAKLSSADLREAFYREHEDHQKARNDQIEVEYELAMAWNALTAFDNRKEALENEVKLWTRNYFAAPTEERMAEAGKRIQDIEQEEKVDKQRVSINRKRRKKE